MESSTLPPYIKPTYYDLYIRYVVGSPTFSGFSTIYMDLERETRVVFLHADKNLTIQRIYYPISQGDHNLAHSYVNDDTIAVTLTHSHNQNVRLTLAFEGNLMSEGVGFFSGYAHDRPAYSTQLSSGNARKVFPCFDDTNFSAKFDLTVAIDDPSGTYSAISNTNLINRQVEQNWKVHKFSQTPQITCSNLSCSIIPS
jgi:aminopeptidase N